MPPGDGGGVCAPAAARPALLDASSKRSDCEREGDVESVLVEDVEIECVRLTFFVGGECEPSLVEGGERADRGAPGSAMPSDGSDSDLRRVL
jgi:hypothetical protein